MNLKNKSNREIMEPILNNIEYEIIKNTQLEIISILIDISKEETTYE
jgi:hypothetical protein